MTPENISPSNPAGREKHKIDATGKVPGRLASEVAILLMGKHKVNYQPHLDQGDFVAIENISQLKFTGKKLEKKVYHRHTQYPGGIKTTPLSKIFKENPDKLFRKMVFQMLPKNKLRKEMIKRLTIS